MKRILSSVVILAMIVAASVRAESDCAPCDEVASMLCDTESCDPCDKVADCDLFDETQCDPCESVLGPNCGKKSAMDSIKFYGWLQAGIRVNEHGNKNTYGGGSPASRNLDPLAGNSYILGFGQPADFKVNQLWLGMAKAKDTRHGWDWGFQADFMFGTDAKYPQCFGDQTFDYDWGSGDYYDSFVQLYAELGYKNLTFRVGKFASPMAGEPVPGPASFFYSHAYFCYSGPLTHNGAVAEWKINDKWTVLGGWTAGYHNSMENPLGDNGFLGQIRHTIDPKRALTYTVYQGWHNGFNKHDDALTRYSRNYWRETETTMSLRYDWKLNRRWTYMLEGLWSQGNMKMGGANPDVLKHTYGVNQHLYYTINKKWSIGLRGEWNNAEGTFFDIPPITGGQETNLYALTFAANWNIFKNVTIRPEVRYDWSFYKNGFKPFGGQDPLADKLQGRYADQLSGGMAVVASF